MLISSDNGFGFNVVGNQVFNTVMRSAPLDGEWMMHILSTCLNPF